MKFPLNSSKHLVRSTIDTICSVIEQGIEQGSDNTQSDEERIHNLRKRCKEIRALLQLVFPVNKHLYKGEEIWFKETAQQLNEQRDRHVFAESLAFLYDHQLIAKRHYKKAKEILCSEKSHPQNSVKLLNNAVSRVSQAKDRFVCKKGKSHIIRDRFMELFFMAQSRFHELKNSSDHEQFHQWRKVVKYHLFHCQLFLNSDPELLSPRVEELKLLGEKLGIIQNMVVLSQTLSSELSAHDFAQEIIKGCTTVINSEKEDVLLRAEQLFSLESEKQLQSLFHNKR